MDEDGWMVEHPVPTKYPTKYAQNMVSDSEVQLLALTWQNCSEQTEVWAKGKLLVPSDQHSG